MALKIIWAFRAKEDIKNISIYWNKRIGNSSYSNKIRRLTNEYLSLLQQYPKLGKQTDNKPVRVIIIREFKIFYVFDETSIYIVRFWDTRQDPERLVVL